MVTLRAVAIATIHAISAGNGRRYDHSVPFFEVSNCSSDLFNDANPFMPQNRTRDHARHRPPDHMQVRTTDCTCRETDNGIRGFFDSGLTNVFKTDIPDFVKHNSLHSILPRPS